jgi:hypothetical protein
MAYKRIIKRISLIFIPIFIFLVSFFPILQNYWAVSIGASISVLIILWNVPRLALLIHRRPKYPEDLVLSSRYDKQTRYRFRRLYQLIMNCCLSILMVSCANYLLYRVPNDQPWLTTIGILGGVLFLYLRIQDATGEAILKLLYFYRNWHHTITPSVSSESLPSLESVELKVAQGERKEDIRGEIIREDVNENIAPLQEQSDGSSGSLRSITIDGSFHKMEELESAIV